MVIFWPIVCSQSREGHYFPFLGWKSDVVGLGTKKMLSSRGIFGRGVAQRLAHLVRDQGVGGSNPLTPTMDIESGKKPIKRYWSVIGAWRSSVAQLHGVQKVAGSNPAAPTIVVG